MRFEITKGEDGVGFDIGRVVTEFLLGRKPGEIGDDYLQVEPYPLAFKAIAVLVDAAGPSLTYAVSYCRTEVEVMTRRWLLYHGFYRTTGFRPCMLGFTQDWKKKADEAMRLTDGRAKSFTDDKLAVLTPMRSVVPHLFLYGDQPEDQVVPDGIEHVSDWTAVLAKHGLSF